MKEIRPKVCVGRVDHVSPYCAFVSVEGLAKDVLVPAKYLKSAIHEDTVRIAIAGQREGGRLEGKVLGVLKRARASLVGTLEREPSGRYIVVPDHKKIHRPIWVPHPKSELNEGDKVIVDITYWASSPKRSIGEVAKVLGKAGTHQAETAAILLSFGLDQEFDPSIEEEVAKYPGTLSGGEIARRRDFRSVATFTIDPASAQDFDDALSVERKPNGDYEIGIHIADVTHYVQEGTLLDKAAYQRGTSVYLVGATVPMLPLRLANDLCSLRPQCERPAFSVVVTFDEKMNLKGKWVGETVIYSDYRFTYESAHQVLQNRQGPYYQELTILDGIAQHLRRGRIQAGAIAFETTDVDITLNEAGEPTDMKPKRSSTTHQLIEEFMLLANRIVAEDIYKKKKGRRHSPFLYRVHEHPNGEKIAQFAAFVKQLGYEFETAPEKLPHSFNAVLERSKGTIHEALLQTLSIRMMAQARYATEPIGHFGLGFAFYTHFTSPIRRYPDLVVHRLTKRYLQHGSWPPLQPYNEIAAYTSSRERLAVEAERASIDYKQVLYMRDRVGQIFEGVVSGVTEWGVYVELLANKCEGMVRITELPGDRYTFDAANFRLVGKDTGKVYQIGMPARVSIKSCNIDRRTVDLAIA